MTCGAAIRTGLVAAAFSAAAASASLAQPAQQQPDLAADLSSLIDWIDSGLAGGASAPEPEARATPALGQGPVSQALDWLLNGTEAPSASAEAPETAAPAAPVARMAQPVAAAPATPVARVPAEPEGPPDGDPLNLEPQPRPVATVRPQGLLLPVAPPYALP